MNRAGAVLLATLALAPTASAHPITLRHDTNAQAVALAGPDALVLSSSVKHGIRVVAVPRTGGRARTLLKVAEAGLTFDNGTLAASAQRVAVIVDIDNKGHRVYSGPPTGPLKLVRATKDPYGEGWEPSVIDVDGDRLLLVEDKETASGVRVSILDRNGWKRIRWAASARRPVAIAGRYVAVRARQRVELADLATGARLAALSGGVRHPRGDFFPQVADVTADGRLAAGMRRGIGLTGLGLLPNSSHLLFPRFAGSALFALDERTERLVRRAADGSWTPVGPKSRVFTDVDGDNQGVAWLFNGCVRYLPLNGSPTARNVCPTTEVSLFLIPSPSKLRNGKAHTPVRCVTGRGGRCRGTLVARIFEEPRIVGRGRFDLPVSKQFTDVDITFDAEAIARFKKDGSGNLVVDAEDPDIVGSGGGGSSELSVEIDEHS
jgi:hypothetical protein